jgi:hypothetical protein
LSSGVSLGSDSQGASYCCFATTRMANYSCNIFIAFPPV